MFGHFIPKFRRKLLAPSAKDFYSEDEGDMFHQYVNKCLPLYTASHNRRHVLHTHVRDSLESHQKKKKNPEFDSVKNMK